MPIWDILASFFDPVWFGQAFVSHRVTLIVFGLACAATGFAIGYNLKAWLVRRDQRNVDADRFLKLPFGAYEPICSIMEAEAAGSRFYTDEESDMLYYLRRINLIEGDFGRYGFMLKMHVRPFFETYADAIHEIAQGTNDDRLRIAEAVRKGRYRGGR